MTLIPTVLKLGGELLEDATRTEMMANAIARAAAQMPLIVVHGGGKEIDAAMAAAGITKTQIDGMRITDAATLSVVVPVLAGAINTRFVAAITAAGAKAVGLTGADATVAPVTPMPPLRAVDGRTFELGFVGQPRMDGSAALLSHLTSGGFVPVIASIGADAHGTLYNVNADTMAAAVAIRSGASRLVIAGTTPGVLDANRQSMATITAADEAALTAAGAINAGMIAKLRACREALGGGVPSVLIADGRDGDRLLDTLLAPAPRPSSATLVVAS